MSNGAQPYSDNAAKEAITKRRRELNMALTELDQREGAIVELEGTRGALDKEYKAVKKKLAKAKSDKVRVQKKYDESEREHGLTTSTKADLEKEIRIRIAQAKRAHEELTTMQKRHRRLEGELKSLGLKQGGLTKELLAHDGIIEGHQSTMTRIEEDSIGSCDTISRLKRELLEICGPGGGVDQTTLEGLYGSTPPDSKGAGNEVGEEATASKDGGKRRKR